MAQANSKTIAPNPMLAIVSAMTAAETVATIAPMTDPLAAARAKFVGLIAGQEKASREWIKDFAGALNDNLPEVWWVLTLKDDSPEGLRTERERKAVYSALKLAEYSNPSVCWKRVKDTAAKLKGWVDSENEEAEEEGEEGEAKASPYAKVQELIASAMKKLGKMEADHKKEIDALADIAKRIPNK